MTQLDQPACARQADKASSAIGEQSLAPNCQAMTQLDQPAPSCAHLLADTLVIPDGAHDKASSAIGEQSLAPNCQATSQVAKLNGVGQISNCTTKIKENH
jgi:hypothetical protein